MQLQLHHSMLVDRQDDERARLLDVEVREEDRRRAGDGDHPATPRGLEIDADRARDAVEGELTLGGLAEGAPVAGKGSQLDGRGQLEGGGRVAARLECLAPQRVVA